MTVFIYAAGVNAPAPFTLGDCRYRFKRLTGAAGDAVRTANLLAAIARPGPTEVTVRSTPEETTVAGITGDIEAVLGRAGPGDIVAIALSGHGVQCDDTDGDEPDGKDEVFAAADGPIVDDFFRDLFAEVPEGLLVVTIADACHSDTMVLAMDAAPPPDVVVRTLPRGASRIAISASQQEEDAEETALVEGGTIGVLTDALVRSWRERPTQASYRTWFADAAKLVRRQHPRLRYLGPDPSVLDRPPLQAP